MGLLSASTDRSISVDSNRPPSESSRSFRPTIDIDEDHPSVRSSASRFYRLNVFVLLIWINVRSRKNTFPPVYSEQVSLTWKRHHYGGFSEDFGLTTGIRREKSARKKGRRGTFLRVSSAAEFKREES
jgi:hypothetical protein